MTEEATFNKLKRTPLEEMMYIINSVDKPIIPRAVMNLNGNVIEQSSIYMQLARHHHYVELLKDHGWNYIDFMTELERKTILEHIQSYNDNLEFPASIIEHARKFFPDVKFTQAKIELE